MFFRFHVRNNVDVGARDCLCMESVISDVLQYESMGRAYVCALWVDRLIREQDKGSEIVSLFFVQAAHRESSFFDTEHFFYTSFHQFVQGGAFFCGVRRDYDPMVFKEYDGGHFFLPAKPCGHNAPQIKSGIAIGKCTVWKLGFCHNLMEKLRTLLRAGENVDVHGVGMENICWQKRMEPYFHGRSFGLGAVYRARAYNV